MSIKDFIRKHDQSCPPIQQVVRRWSVERHIDDFLHTNLMPGLMIADLFIDDSMRLADRQPIPEAVQKAFSNLMGEKADSYEEVRSLILDKIEKGEQSLLGLRNKVQGQLGEDLFISVSEGKASLAGSGSQEAWDVSVNHGNSIQYVQVKVYEDPEIVMEKILEVQEKLGSGSISGVNGEVVTSIDFAINSDILEDVQRKVAEHGLDIKLMDIGSTHEEIRSQLMDGFNSAAVSPFDNFFGELLEDVLAVGSIPLAVCAFQIYFQAKDQNQAIEDALYRAAVSAGAGAAGFAAEALIANVALVLELEVAAAIFAGPVGVVGAIGTAAILRRFFDRRYVLQRIAENNTRQRQLIAVLNAV